MKKKRKKITKSYTFNGTCKGEYEDWLKWMDDAEYILELLGLKPEICGVGSKKGNNINSARTIRRSIKKLYERGDEVNNISYICMDDPDGFIIFDYLVTLTKQSDRKNYVTLILNMSSREKLKDFDEEEIIEILRSHVDNAQGEIYEMDMGECPEMYAEKINSIEDYPSLKVIRKL